MTAPLGLAALTVLDTPPPQQVELAERHGFDTVGLRLLPAVPGTTAWSIGSADSDSFAPGSASFMVNYRVADLVVWAVKYSVS